MDLRTVHLILIALHLMAMGYIAGGFVAWGRGGHIGYVKIWLLLASLAALIFWFFYS